MELLAPAGSFSSLKAAIQGGADAVYMGGRSFSARRYAQNFSDKELEQAVSLAHDNGVKAYVAVNTLIKDAEMRSAVDFIRYLQRIGTDAVILQDVGLLHSIREIEIEKHASTQMGIHSRDGLAWAHDHGIRRVILARELSLPELAFLAEESPVELEVFVHGALCYCISGQCLFSSMAGGRSGNRGACAQPCRKPYRMGEREGFLLSTKDLCCLDQLQELQRMGIHAVKLEGRMRGEAYTGIASSAYAKALNRIKNGLGGDPLEDSERWDLETVFNRGMGPGYLHYPAPVVNSLYADNRGMPMGTVNINNGIIDLDPGRVLSSDGLALYKGNEKIGGLRVDDPSNLKLPFSVPDGNYDLFRNSSAKIASWKREATDGKRTNDQIAEGQASTRSKSARNRKSADLSFYVSSVKCLEAVLPYADRVYYEWNRTLTEAHESCQAQGVEIVAILSRFDPLPVEDVPTMPLMVNSLDQFQRHSSSRIYASHHLNLFNSAFPFPVHQATLSPELSRGEIEGISSRYRGRLEQMVFGRVELMVTRDPEMDDGTLQDERGYKFPVYKDRFGLSHILNSADLMLLEHLQELDAMGVDSHGIDLRRRPAKLASLVARAFHDRDLDLRREIRSACGQVTYGHYLRGV